MIPQEFWAARYRETESYRIRSAGYEFLGTDKKTGNLLWEKDGKVMAECPGAGHNWVSTGGKFKEVKNYELV